MRISAKISITVFAVTICILLYGLFASKLFAFNPLYLGFKKVETQRAIIYLENDTANFNTSSIDAMIADVEQFHQLNFAKKPKILVFSDSISYLNKNITRARFCAYPNGVLVISPWARKDAKNGIINMDIYIHHELSHIILFQHMSTYRWMRYPNWLLEGVAVYSANQLGTSWYPSKDETYTYIKRGNFIPPEVFKTRNEDKVKTDVPYRITFFYSEFACMINFLNEKYGREQFINYLHKSLSQDHDETFNAVYGISFQNFLNDFQRDVMK